MKRFFLLLILLTMTGIARAQRDTALFKRIVPDTGSLKMNMDAVYNRPFVQAGKLPAILGGYVEANSAYFSEDGVSEGLSFQLPRLTLFIASTIRRRIKFLSEIELEEGGREINIEFASVDVELNPLLNLRGGVIMNPIGAFNQNHDGPKWEFISRPVAATTIIPATWSTVGFGVFGKYARDNWVWAYEAYLTNGFDNKIINNNQNRTWMPAAKANAARFEESFNGAPLVTLKGAVRHRRLGEIGISWMGGVYNKYREDGIDLDKKRRVDFLALDYNTRLSKWNTAITGEWVWAWIGVPPTYTQQYGRRQQGGFVDLVQPILQRELLGWNQAAINLALRGEYADYNVGRFMETGGKIYDQVTAIVPGISFRPSAQTVLRANYRYEWHRDLLGNPAKKIAGFQFGLSTYF
ncbi:hypothetical protein LL912_02260 [Niabella sp. CC-SYL272]|uniref:hypothetical protein n=1 Tax=Niabella agricola TaxID=2891571 RepID=UPI001F42D9CD|nr:hypothetical protein [Niabella agricola]MCF3107593.1 hypothetical protein [Niabella agricola]